MTFLKQLTEFSKERWSVRGLRKTKHRIDHTDKVIKKFGGKDFGSLLDDIFEAGGASEARTVIDGLLTVADGLKAVGINLEEVDKKKKKKLNIAVPTGAQIDTGKEPLPSSQNRIDTTPQKVVHNPEVIIPPLDKGPINPRIVLM